MFSLHAFWRTVLPAVVISSLQVAVSAQDGIDADAIFRSWRSRQERTKTLTCEVDSFVNYAARSQVVVGNQRRLPPAPRSVKRFASLWLGDSERWRIDQRGDQFHRRFGKILDMKISRFSDGERFKVTEQPYVELPNWEAKPLTYSAPRTSVQEAHWQDLLLTPVLLHYRPFNQVLCPFAEREYVVDPVSRTIDGCKCVLLRPSDDAPFSVRNYRYWICPDREFVVMRIERTINDSIEWEFDIQHLRVGSSWRPSSYMIRRLQQTQRREYYKVNVVKLRENVDLDEALFDLSP